MATRLNGDDQKKRSRFPGLASLFGAGGITGAGIATGSKATQSMMRYSGGKLQALFKQVRKKVNLSDPAKPIEFVSIKPQIPPGSKYPLPVLQSSWRKLKKPSRKTLGGILRQQDRMGRLPTMVFRDSYKELSVKLDNLIEFKLFVPSPEERKKKITHNYLSSRGRS